MFCFFFVSATFNVNFGLHQDGSTIWLASNEYMTYPANALYRGDIAARGYFYYSLRGGAQWSVLLKIICLSLLYVSVRGVRYKDKAPPYNYLKTPFC